MTDFENPRLPFLVVQRDLTERKSACGAAHPLRSAGWQGCHLLERLSDARAPAPHSFSLRLGRTSVRHPVVGRY